MTDASVPESSSLFLCWTHSSNSVFVLDSPELDAVLQMWFHQGWVEGRSIFIVHKSKPFKKKRILYITGKIWFVMKDTCSCSQYSESLRTLLKDEKVLQLFCLLNRVLGKPCHNCNCSLKGYFTGDLPVLMLTVFC